MVEMRSKHIYSLRVLFSEIWLGGLAIGVEES